MKKLLIITMLLVAVTSAYAKDPKETVEYWQNKSIEEALVEINKCWDSGMHQYFKVKEGSKQWNICIATLVVFDPMGRGWNFDRMDKYHRELKKRYTK